MKHYKHDSDATALAYEDEYKEEMDPSPTESQFPEFPNTANPAVEAPYNKPLPRRREETFDSRRCPPVIPLSDSPDRRRTLVLCFDGTGDEFDADNSNIVQLVSLLKKDDNQKQLVYYQSGIGTYAPSSTSAKLFVRSIQKTFDQMVGSSIDHHVMGGYKFLMQNYIQGDKICLFGFSRGAYTARSLAGMLYKVGLLPAGNNQQVPFAYNMYTRRDEVGLEQSNEFKKAFSVDVSIEFVGVWDTVSSLGVVPKTLPVTTARTSTRIFRHAISLDERRAKFQPNFWNSSVEEERHLYRDDTAEKTNIDVKEVWFAGCHCDVGGGAVSNKTRHSLARIPLRWMIRECFKTNTGILFNSDSLYKVGLDPSTLHPFVVPRPASLPIDPTHLIQKLPATPIPIKISALLKFKKKEKEKKHNILAGSEDPFLGTEEEEELRDALSPKYDMLKLRKAWWILEILPLQILQLVRGDDGRWVKRFGPHLGSPRFIPHREFQVHRSVRMRKEAGYEDESAQRRGKRYCPKPHFYVDPIWVD